MNAVANAFIGLSALMLTAGIGKRRKEEEVEKGSCRQQWSQVEE